MARPKFDFHTGLDDKMQRRYVAELAKVVRTSVEINLEATRSLSLIHI